MPFIQYTKPQEDGIQQVEWTPYPKPKFRFKRVPKPSTSFSMDEEAIAILTEWYKVSGLPVPLEEIEACRGADALAAKVHEAQQAAPSEAKLVYGTPEFWKDYWKKKNAKKAQADAAAAALLAKAQAEFASRSTN